MKKFLPFILIALAMTPLAKLWIDNTVAAKCYELDGEVPPPPVLWSPFCSELVTIHRNGPVMEKHFACQVQSDSWIDATTGESLDLKNAVTLIAHEELQ